MLLLAMAAAGAAPTMRGAAQVTQWTTTGSLNSGRVFQTATLLGNGKILVAGGMDTGGNSLASAELFDPANGTWTPTGNLNTARYSHTATLLPSGKVLVAGGYDSSTGSQLASAELYDPGTGVWTPTGGSPSIPRQSHTATLLGNGMVLVAGGWNGADVGACELYDPVADSWALTGTLNVAREDYTATLLPDGTVLAAGGDGSAGNRAEIYDPVAAAWTQTANLNSFHANHTATLLPNGQVLVAAGADGGSYQSAELYDPLAESWTATGSLNVGREYHSATLLPNGQVLVAGGEGSDGSTSIASAELYDPSAGVWTATGNLNTGRQSQTATLLASGKVLVAGGNDGGSYSGAEFYDSASGAWAATGNLSNMPLAAQQALVLPNGMPLVSLSFNLNGDTSFYYNRVQLYYPNGQWGFIGYAPFNVGAPPTVLANGKALFAGGLSQVGEQTNEANLLDLPSQSWSQTGSLNMARSQHTATLLANGKVVVAGGLAPGGLAGYPLASSELYDPAVGVWVTIGSLNTARYGHTATLLPSGQVLATGGLGFAPNPLASAELFNPATGMWSVTGSMNVQRSGHTATLLPNGKVLVAGGYPVTGSSPTATAELYDPVAGAWSLAGAMINARANHTATLLPNGTVLVTGGISTSGSAISNAEIYDPMTGAWTATGNMTAPRAMHSALLLPSGQVMAIAGASEGVPGSCELYDPGLGFSAASQPQVTGGSTVVASGSSLTLTGAGFLGLSGASGGNTQDSSTDYPVVELTSLQNGQSEFLLSSTAAPWSDSSFQSDPIAGFPAGSAWATVFTNGIPSASYLVDVTPPPTTPPVLSPVTLVSSDPYLSTYAAAGDTITLSFTSSEPLLAPPSVTLAGFSGIYLEVVNTGGNSYSASIIVESGFPQGPVAFSIAVADTSDNIVTGTATTDSSAVNIDTGPNYGVTAVRGSSIPGYSYLTYVSLGTPEPGAFSGVITNGKETREALYGSNGDALAVWAPGVVAEAPSGDALLIYYKGGSLIYDGLTSGTASPVLEIDPPASAAKLPTSQPKKILEMDGNGADIFFLASRVGKPITGANNIELEANVGDMHISTLRKGENVRVSGTEKTITDLTTFTTSRGTAADGRWRAGDDAFGARLTFQDKSQAIGLVTLTGTVATLGFLAETGPITSGGLNGTIAKSLGLPGFSYDSEAHLVNLEIGIGGVTAASDVGLVRVPGTLFARTGAPAPGVTGAPMNGIVFKTLADPVSGAHGSLAWEGTLAGAGVTPANNSGIWYSNGATAPMLIARTGTNIPAPGGGHWARFISMVLPQNPTTPEGPIFLATLAPSRADGVNGTNNLGLWATNGAGYVELLFRSGQSVVVNGTTETVRTFSALAAAAGSAGAASGYTNAGTVGVLATFTDRTQALLTVSPP